MERALCALSRILTSVAAQYRAGCLKNITVFDQSSIRLNCRKPRSAGISEIQSAYFNCKLLILLKI
jgi:hypothetical protein